MIKYIFSFCCLAVILSSCEDAFTTTLNVDPPEHTPQMAVHAYLMDDYESIGFSVVRTYGILQNTQNFGDQYLENATVEIFQQGELKYTVPALSESVPQAQSFLPINYGMELSEPIAGLGDSFEIVVNHPDFGTVRGVQYMPTQAVQITEAKFDEDGGLDEGGERINAVDITFTDQPGVENFYEVILAKKDEFAGEVYYNSLYTMTVDPNAQEGSDRSYLLSDQTFEGKEFTLSLDLYENYNENMVVILRTVTRDWFLFSKSLRDFGGGDDFGFFAEPVTVHSNLEGGLGVFCMGTEVIVPLEE